MAVFKIIPQAKKSIEQLLARLNLTPEKDVPWFIKNKKHLYASKCRNRDGQAVFIKAILENTPRTFTSLKNEASIVKFFSQHKSLSKKINTTNFLGGNLEPPQIWYLHKFIPGKIMGEFYDLSIPQSKYIKPLVQNIVSLHNISPANIKKIKQEIKTIDTVPAESYIKILREHSENSPKLRKLVNFKAVNQFLKHQYKFLKKAPLVLTHGDFTFANQIINQNKVYLTDWEWVRFGNFCVDLAHLWVQSWRYPSWQKILLRNYLATFKSKNTVSLWRENFRLIVIVQALNELRWNVEICPKKYKSGATKFCLAIIQDSLDNKLNI